MDDKNNMLEGIKGIHHIAISVPDLAQARAFYCGVLGFEVAEEFDFGPDEEADRGGGRRNLVILLGRRAAAALYAVTGLLVPITLVVAVALDSYYRRRVST